MYSFAIFFADHIFLQNWGGNVKKIQQSLFTLEQNCIGPTHGPQSRSPVCLSPFTHFFSRTRSTPSQNSPSSRRPPFRFPSFSVVRAARRLRIPRPHGGHRFDSPPAAPLPENGASPRRPHPGAGRARGAPLPASHRRRCHLHGGRPLGLHLIPRRHSQPQRRQGRRLIWNPGSGRRALAHVLRPDRGKATFLVVFPTRLVYPCSFLA
jgi:hypothetical protein